jgi:uncharacterized protein
MNEHSQNGTALITGASSGIGATYADRLARRGYDLILVARNHSRLEEVATRIKRETGVRVDCVPADLNTTEGVRVAEDLLRNDTRITMLINNAGTGVAAPTMKSDIDAMQAMIELNVTALTRLAYAAARAFVERRSGTIINISSALALAPELSNGVYGATKAFVLAFSQALNNEVAGTGVRVQVVMPGAIATDFWARAGSSLNQLPPHIVMSVDDAVDAALAGLDLGELATIPSLEDAQDWLSFDEARRALRPKLSLAVPASRYGAVKRDAA